MPRAREPGCSWPAWWACSAVGDGTAGSDRGLRQRRGAAGSKASTRLKSRATKPYSKRKCSRTAAKPNANSNTGPPKAASPRKPNACSNRAAATSGSPSSRTSQVSTRATTYYWRIHASNEHGTVNGDEKSLHHAADRAARQHRTGRRRQAHAGDAQRLRDTERLRSDAVLLRMGTPTKKTSRKSQTARRRESQAGGEPSEPVLVSANLSGLAESPPTTTVWSPRTPSAKTSAAGTTSDASGAPHANSKTRSSSNATQPRCGATQAQRLENHGLLLRIRPRSRTSPQRVPCESFGASAVKPGKKSTRQSKACRKAPNTGPPGRDELNRHRHEGEPTNFVTLTGRTDRDDALRPQRDRDLEPNWSRRSTPRNPRRNAISNTGPRRRSAQSRHAKNRRAKATNW